MAGWEGEQQTEGIRAAGDLTVKWIWSDWREEKLGAAARELTQLCLPHPTAAVSVPIPMCSHHQAWMMEEAFPRHGASRTMHPDFLACSHMVCSAESGRRARGA